MDYEKLAKELKADFQVMLDKSDADNTEALKGLEVKFNEVIDNRVKELQEKNDVEFRKDLAEMKDEILAELPKALKADEFKLEWKRKNGEFVADRVAMDGSTGEVELNISLADAYNLAAGDGVQNVQRAPGSPVSRMPVWTQMLPGNDWVGYTMYNAPEGDSFKIPNLSRLRLQERPNLSTPFVRNAESADITVNIRTLDTEELLSMTAQEDVNDYLARFMEALVYADSEEKGMDIYSTIKTSVNAQTGVGKAGTGNNFRKIQTKGDDAASRKLAQQSKILPLLAEVKKTLPTYYRSGAVWHISPEVESRVENETASSGDYAFDQSLGLSKLWGTPVIVTDQMPDGETANDIVAVYSNLRNSIVMANRKNLVITVNPYTHSGAHTIYGVCRFKSAVVDWNSLVGLETRGA